MESEIKIICNIPEDEDEKGANGLWDLAGELALIAGLSRNYDKVVYPEDYGQDRIYYKLRSYCK